MIWDSLATSFTWSNYRENNVIVKECFDRFCADAEWSLIFSDAAVSHVDFYFLDHLPIVLNCKPRASKGCSGKCRFQFENMWIIDPSCMDVISTAWSSIVKSDMVDNLMGRLDAFATKLQWWN